MNDPAVKAALGVPSHLKFQTCNSQVHQAFWSRGDSVHNTAALLPEMVNDGVRLLVYAGNAGQSSTSHRRLTHFAPLIIGIIEQISRAISSYVSTSLF